MLQLAQPRLRSLEQAQLLLVWLKLYRTLVLICLLQESEVDFS